jgi:hypothetical protein
MMNVDLKTRAAVVAGAILLTGVAPASAQSISDKLNSWLFGPPAASETPVPTNTPADIDCPGVEVRQGASTLAVNASATEASPMTLRYQVGIGDTARECAPLGAVMTMKVGVQGRILLGPAGGPGQIDIPLRMAVVQEGANPKTVVSKFYRLPVTIPPGQVSIPFMYVEQDITFPMPRARDLDAYVVYVGFDPSGAPAKPQRKPVKKQKRK